MPAMRAQAQATRVAIAGASSLLGKELKQLLDDSGFPAAEIRLLDEEFVAGTLTEAGGEPAVIQTLDEDSLRGLRFVFFTGSSAFADRHWQAADRAGATVIDLSGGLLSVPTARPWIPALDPVLVAPTARQGAGNHVYVSPATPTIVACALAAALRSFQILRMTIVFFQPVSEHGQAGVAELESQTVKLLSFQPIGQEVFDAQVAFNLLDRYGPASELRLAGTRERIAREVRRYLEGRAMLPAIQLVQAPVFYSYAFTAYAELASPPDEVVFARALEPTGVKVATKDEPAPSNVSVAGETRVVLGRFERDPNVECGWWLWGAADNLRVAAANACSIAEKLLAS